MTNHLSRTTVLSLILVAFALTACSSTQQSTTCLNNPSSAACSDVQPADIAILQNGESVTLSSNDAGQYVPKEIRVKLGSTVRIEGDTETLVGGMDTVIIDGYDVRKKIVSGDNSIEFVADKQGTFKMYCANGMGKGLLIVE